MTTRSIDANSDHGPSGVPRVRIDLEWTVVPIPAAVTVWRITDGNQTVIRNGAEITLTAGLATVYDYEAPFDTNSVWVMGDASGAQSVTVQSFPLNVFSGLEPWLIHPGRPDSSVPLKVLSWPSWTRPVSRGIHQPVGRRSPVVVSTIRQAESGDLSVYTDSASDHDALLAILADGMPLLLKGTSIERAGARWVAIGDVTAEPHDVDLRSFVVWGLPLQVVDEPSGVSLPAVTYAQASAAFSSYADAANKAATYADRSAGGWL